MSEANPKSKRIKRLYLKCPNCGQVALWEGYPSNPILSMVECRRCGYIGPGCSYDKEVISVEGK
jgi:predicted RNA-binding Zn-ribbon protein involved in translation (DUF1610 family)